MSRIKGDLSISQNFEIKVQAPIDARLYINTIADLTKADTWANTSCYKGMLPLVKEDNNYYKLISDPNIVTNPIQWVWEVTNTTGIFIDPTPTENSTNAVSSGGVYNELLSKADQNHTQNAETINIDPIDNYDSINQKELNIEIINKKADKTVATNLLDGLMSSTDKSKLDGIEQNANNYTHPVQHSPSVITQDENNRFVTDIQINNWNNKIDSSEKGANSGVATLDLNGKVPVTQLPTTLLTYKGSWNATTNVPILSNNDITKAGYIYVVATAGDNLGFSWGVGDWLIYNDQGIIEKADNVDDVISVNGKKGIVELNADDIDETANRLWFTLLERTKLQSLEVNIINTTYYDLLVLKTNNNLKIGQSYKITDYQTIHNITNTSPVEVNTGPIEPLIVTAISTKN